jgi:hypothetical protein
MPILCIAALLVGISIAQSKIPPSKEGSDKKGGSDKKEDSGEDKPKLEDAKKPFSLSDIQGEMTLYVSTKKPGGDKA